jgi:hypothetical protein
MFKLLAVGAMVLSLVAPVFAQVEPQALVGVWEGQWSYREQRGMKTGPITITISKVENGKVYGKTEAQGSQENTAYSWVGDATPTGYSFTSKEGNATTATLEGGRLHVRSGRGARVTSVLDKK